MRNIYIGLYNEFHEFKIDFMTHKQNHRKKKKNKEKKRTCNSVDGGFDKTFYYKQNNLNNIYRGSYN